MIHIIVNNRLKATDLVIHAESTEILIILYENHVDLNYIN